jgi:hypothetical protein
MRPLPLTLGGGGEEGEKGGEGGHEKGYLLFHIVIIFCYIFSFAYAVFIFEATKL